MSDVPVPGCHDLSAASGRDRETGREKTGASLVTQWESQKRCGQDWSVAESEDRRACAALAIILVQEQGAADQFPIGRIRGTGRVSGRAQEGSARPEKIDPLSATSTASVEGQVIGRADESALVGIDAQAQLRAGKETPSARDPDVADRKKFVLRFEIAQPVGTNHGTVTPYLGITHQADFVIGPTLDALRPAIGRQRPGGHRTRLTQCGIDLEEKPCRRSPFARGPALTIRGKNGAGRLLRSEAGGEPGKARKTQRSSQTGNAFDRGTHARPGPVPGKFERILYYREPLLSVRFRGAKLPSSVHGPSCP